MLQKLVRSMLANRYSTVLLLLLASLASAKAGTITTAAGGGPNNLPALQANLVDPRAVAFDGNGNFYVAVGAAVFKVDSSGMLTLVAGNGTSGFTGDGGLATGAVLNGASGVAVDSADHVLIADTFNHRVRRVDATTGLISTVAGTGLTGSTCSGCMATDANLNQPMGVALDATGNLYIVLRGSHAVIRVHAETRTVSFVAGTGFAGFSGDGGSATSAKLFSPSGLALDAAGNLLIADSGNHRIRRVETATGTITTVAGFSFGFSGDGGPATSASLNFPLSVTVDSSGNFYIADTNNRRIRKVDTASVITTVAGNGAIGGGGDGGPATSASLGVPNGVAVGSSGNLLISDSNTLRVREVAAATGFIRTVAGNGTVRFSGDGFAATDASLNFPLGVAVDGSSNLYIAEFENRRVRKVDVNGTITTFLGGGIRAFIGRPYGLAVDAVGNLYVADNASHVVRKVDTSGTLSTVAGTGARGFSGDGGPATNATLNFPSDVAVDSNGNLYIADSSNHRIRKVDPAGIITTVVASNLGFPRGVAVDDLGNLYIANTGRCRILKMDTAGIVTTVAGDGRCSFGNGDGIPSTSASLNEPEDMFIDASGALFISDTRNHRIRKVDANGIISTVAGNGVRGFKGDGGPATSASMAFPTGIGSDPSGALYIGDRFNHRVRRFPLNQPPVAEAGPDQLLIVGEGGTFDGSASFDPDGSIQLYVWDFGDGVSSSGAAVVSHAYATAGTFTATLTVTDDQGESDSDTASVTVQTQAEAIQSLSQLVQSFNFQQGISNSLDAKLENVLAALQAANAEQRQDAANKLQAFIQGVEAQRGKEITNAQADQLIALAQRILAVL